MNGKVLVLVVVATGAVAVLAGIADKGLTDAARLLRLACFQPMPAHGCLVLDIYL